MADKILDLMRYCFASEPVLRSQDVLSKQLITTRLQPEDQELDEDSLMSITGGVNSVRIRVKSRVLQEIRKGAF